MKTNLRTHFFYIIILSCIFLLTGCTRNTEPFTQTGFYFDTVIQVTLYDSQDSSVMDGCFSLAETYENMLSATVEGSDIWRINHSEGAPVTVSDDTAFLLQKALDYARLTDGTVDPTILPVSSLWDFGSDSTPHIPEESALKNALTHVSYSNVILNDNTVYLKDPDAAIDLGFIAKGYIADQMKEYLLSEGITSACINLGGNVMLIGSKPDGSAFKIGIQKAFADEGETSAVVSVSDTSVVTSGIYERYFYEGDTLYHHILDTKTGYPVENNITSVTIICASSVDADALSTTCFCLGVEKGAALLDTLPDTEYLFLLNDGTQYASEDFPVVD
jgi:thiamine biosynthesis lipoprotein